MSIHEGSSASATSVDIVTNGYYGVGLIAGWNASIAFDVGTIVTNGQIASGVLLTSNNSGNSVVTVSDSQITTNGSDAPVVATTSTGSTSQIFQATNSTLRAAGGGVVFDIDSANGVVQLTDVTASSAAARLLSVGATSTTNLSLTASGSTLSGDSVIQNGSTAALAFGNGTTLTGAFSTGAGSSASVEIDSSSSWYVTDDSNLTNLTNAGLVQFTPPASSVGPFKTLTTVNYVGQGGTLGINTYLGGDGSPSDKLVIDGGTGTGTSLLSVNNLGAGDLTQLNGILVVDAINGGTTVPGLFALAGPVVAGPYEYSLYRGSVDASNPDAWFLRSVLDCALDPSAPICAPDTPDYRQETSLYAAVPAMTLLYGRLMLDTLHERRGTAVSAYAEGAPNAAWARVIGQHGDRDGGKGGIYGAGPKYDYDFWAFQGGIDLYRDGDVGTSRNHAGAFFAIGHGSGDVQHIGSGKAGENSFMAYSWGAYWTHYTPENAYVDALLMGSWYDIDAKSNRIPKMKTDGGAFGASLEGGYPVYTGPGGFSIEPQAQLAYQTVNLNNGSDVAAQVHFDNVNSLVGRVGVSFAQDFGTPTWLTGAPSTFTAWIRPNFWYEFLGDPKTKFSSATGFIPFAADMGGTTFEINTGFSTDIGDGAAIYANASYLVGIGEHADGNAYDGKLGVKVAW
ncbi:autotransporter outer membrane beta-barrel domain-containing protein [Hyphomicrobium sulfonivorans]|uniref:autotransporter family protein n=1 Tax=Hyphomicrobium sulfonivorans TaxID=121290 RepID=UPI00156E8AF4|nr:autotransporter outer membrane beta-barrel domain-containing protein [Hyphomicrobium sulfonivorans]MBI1649896.1 autotransporter outer membrane beta-barrel domain-containing protein [Hyphomicrobium sulfonivorans]